MEYDSFTDDLVDLVDLVAKLAMAVSSLTSAQIKIMSALVELPTAITKGDDVELKKAVNDALDKIEATDQIVGEALAKSQKVLEARQTAIHKSKNEMAKKEPEDNSGD